jgi:hypothetical protein
MLQLIEQSGAIGIEAKAGIKHRHRRALLQQRLGTRNSCRTGSDYVHQ